ncbi:TIGR03564 family F420-dependent LLM class oxidoreductase [Nakamurella sp.]|uniref:TIGR03564 family F420-dependent LLM class oxidoreductase n=1 Tax=Nakamurella sp. TaxID=1869182 RepID=UPI003B3AA166
MRIGIGVGDIAGRGSSPESQIAQIRALAEQGVRQVWLAQIFGADALTMIAVAGAQTPGIEFGTAVVPTYPRHPTALAAQAMTVQALTGSRLTLGVGPSHREVVEDMFGLDYTRPARHMREYLTVLGGLLRGDRVDVTGETLRVNARLTVPGSSPPSVLVAALGPVMLRLAGRLADGTVTWMTGPETLAGHTVPVLVQAAAEAGRPAPRVVAGLPICLTADPAAARERAARQFAMYGQLPNYRAMLDREGADGPADLAVVGDEAALVAGLDRLAAAGVTEFLAVPFGTREQIAETIGFLAARSGGRAGGQSDEPPGG